MAHGGKAVASQRERERMVRRHAMEPVKAALVREGRPVTWLMRQLASRGGVRVTQSALYNYLNGWARVPSRSWIATTCLIAGANPGDVYARIAGQEAVLFQQEPRGQHGK